MPCECEKWYNNRNILTSLLSAPEREVTSPSDFKVVGALQLSYSGEKLLNVAEHSQNRSKIDHLKGAVDGFSYFSLIFSNLIF